MCNLKWLIFFYFKVLIKTCPELSVLILSPNKTIDDQSAAVLSGVQELVVKGPLKKTISVNNPTKNHRLRLLDISNTSITINGRDLLQNCLPNCSIITWWQNQSVTWNNLLKRYKLKKTQVIAIEQSTAKTRRLLKKQIDYRPMWVQFWTKN